MEQWKNQIWMKKGLQNETENHSATFIYKVAQNKTHNASIVSVAITRNKIRQNKGIANDEYFFYQNQSL